MNIDDFPSGKEFDNLVTATRIKETIIDLADSLETEKELWDSYRVLSKAMSYLSAKHTIAQTKEESN